MGQLFIDEVRAIVLKNISNEKFGVGDLSSQLGLSSSQTLRKVKAASGKSVNQYIRELRLEKAAKLIKKTDDSMAEIAYQVGFSSPSYFNKAFAKYYGIAPGEYKTKSISLSELADQKPEPQTGLSTKKIGYVLATILVFVLGYSLLQSTVLNKKPEQKSIAVLPFKDFSPKDSQWFSDGVSDNILHSLAQMHDLSVTSFTSSATYRDTDKQIPQIAKELGVAYVLEGSITLYENDLKIIVQLIDADDNHVWSREYNENFDDVITIQNNVAQEVMQQLKTTLSPEEEKILQKLPTQNMEAYNLHLEGRRLNHSRKYADLKKNWEYNQKAIALDSGFVDAYVEVAASNLEMALIIQNVAYQTGSYVSFTKKANSYIDKALIIDPESARANAVKARLLLHVDRVKSEHYFKKAITLNPSDAESRHWYAKYYLTKDNPNLNEALNQATIANVLSPFSSMIATRYAWLLILNNKYDEVDAFIADYDFLFSLNYKSLFTTYSIVGRNKSWQAAMDYWHQKLEEEPENAIISNLFISMGYDQIFKDRHKAVEFAKKASELSSFHLYYWFRSLTSNGFLKEAEQFMKTDVFEELHERQKIYFSWLYSYYKKDYITANELINKNSEKGIFGFRDVSITYAQLGDQKKLDSLGKRHLIKIDQIYLSKANVHAILKERDSMYFYLNKSKYSFNFGIALTNLYPEFNPYRNEKRFKSLLREMYLPTEGEQYTPPSSDN